MYFVHSALRMVRGFYLDAEGYTLAGKEAVLASESDRRSEQCRQRTASYLTATGSSGLLLQFTASHVWHI